MRSLQFAALLLGTALILGALLAYMFGRLMARRWTQRRG